MRNLILFFLLVILCCDLYSQDDRWILLGESPNYIVYYDKLTIDDSNKDKIIAWIKKIPKTTQIDTKTKKNILYVVQRCSVSGCSKILGRQIDWFYYKIYYEGGWREDDDSYIEKNIEPDSISEKLINTICIYYK